MLSTGGAIRFPDATHELENLPVAPDRDVLSERLGRLP